MDQRLQDPAVAAPPDWRGLCEELVQLDTEQPSEYADWKQRWNAAIKRARTALAQPEPEGRPAPAPAGERQAAPVPVAVSERPWEREGWCDDEGRCWFCNAYSMGKWSYETPPDPDQDWGRLGTLTHSLPHGVIPRPLPLPSGEVEA